MKPLHSAHFTCAMYWKLHRPRESAARCPRELLSSARCHHQQPDEEAARGRPCPQLRWRRQRRVTWWGQDFPLLSVAALRQHGAGCAGALPQPGQGQRTPLPPAGAARRAALPSRALRLRGDQGAAGRRVRAMLPEVRTGTRTRKRHRALSRLMEAGRRSRMRAGRVRRYRLRWGHVGGGAWRVCVGAVPAGLYLRSEEAFGKKRRNLTSVIFSF